MVEVRLKLTCDKCEAVQGATAELVWYSLAEGGDPIFTTVDWETLDLGGWTHHEGKTYCGSCRQLVVFNSKLGGVEG